MTKNNLKKIDLSKALSNKIGFSTHLSKKIVDDLIDILKSTIFEKKILNLKGLGTFKIIFKNARKGRNPKTKKTYLINERNVVIFKASNNLTLKVNKNE